MDKTIALTLIILLFLPIVFAPDLELEEGILTKDDVIIKQNQQSILGLAEVNQKLDTLSDHQIAIGEQSIEMFKQITANSQTQMTITFIIILVAVLGLNWAIKLMLKSKGVI